MTSRPALRRPKRRVSHLKAALSLLLVTGGLWLGREPLLISIGSFLVVEDPLEPVQAIVVLDGGVPYREQEAARLYLDGWAPRIFLTRGTGMPDGSADRVQVLQHYGVTAQALTIVDGLPTDTRAEADLLAEAIGPRTSAVILVTSPFHSRRAALAWWQATGGRSRAIVRPARQDSFDTGSWWHSRESTLEVWHEYFGLVAYVLGLRGN